MNFKVLVFLILFSCCTISVFCQWDLVCDDCVYGPSNCNGPTTNEFEFEFSTPSYFYYWYLSPRCGPNSPCPYGLSHSSDSGKTWMGSPSAYYLAGGYPCDVYFMNFDAYNDTIFVSLQHQPSIFNRSVDGGINWYGFLVYPGIALPRKISVYNGRYGYGIDNNGDLFRIDHDSCYKILTDTNLVNFRIFKFISDSTGFLSKDNILFKTDNGGITWNNILNDTAGILVELCFLDDSVAILSAVNNHLYKTADRGNTWQRLPDLPYLSYNFAGYDKNHIYAIANGTGFRNFIIASKDGGNHWDSLPFDNHYDPMKIKLFNDSTGYLLARRQYFKSVFRLSTSLTSVEPVNIAAIVSEIYPNPFINELNFSFNENVEAEFFNVLGKSIFKSNFRKNEKQTLVMNIASGIYFLRIYSAKRSETIKVIRAR